MKRREPVLTVKDKETIRAFNKLWHESITGTWHKMRWLGVKALKTPCDFWVYQEILASVKPKWIIETGSCFGGSALFLATICDALDSGHIISIDIRPPMSKVEHPRITFYKGSSTDEKTAAYVRKRVKADPGRALVILDSAHHKEHVARELMLYSPLVTQGSYIIVEDTALNRDVRKDHGPGPWEATKEFLAKNNRFQVDKNCERYYLTFNPDGYLKCVR